MPAIQPARLKAQAARLAELFSQPQAFTRELTTILEGYADYTHRFGQAGEPPPLLPTLNTPSPVFRQIWLEILPLTNAHPQEALNLCDVLWQQPYLEHRLLAADLLGEIALEYSQEVTKRIQSWIKSGIEERLVVALLTRGLARLQTQATNTLIEQAQLWLSSSDIYDQKLSLRLLYNLSADPAFDNLPAIFKLISPYIRSTPKKLRPDILACLTNLIHRSPFESAYILRQQVSTTDNPDAAWLLRQVITEFPLEIQTALREAIRLSEASKQ